MLLMVSAHRSATPPSGTPKPGLRERKKLQTRQAIRRAAYRLFAERGYDATPVDRIAEAAEVSPSTVFRYFPTKEDIVLADGRHGLLEAGLRARPVDEPVVESMRQITVEALRRLTARERGELVQRVRLIREVPAVRGRTAENTARDAARLTAVLAERSGRPAGDPELRVIGAALLAALQEAMLAWVETGPEGDPAALVHRAMDVLARGLTP
ncbi:TetR family transcriptional regulator [Streptomyces kronopolitis]|uniref:TetR family transcriptional regulator n=2 Tax=Streptomyces kronopolitis TaxID=1612435 RepID=A0ABQ2J937_9ACTN|nr:TetR/AcrR family transcriptional regulator [Streptomyces kronopolitis]GGN41355.1 TetR family transcriptional regulator [Streptomyces kronopolitis]